MKTGEENNYNVPNLNRALTIIEFLSNTEKTYGISELADELQFPKNSVFRILKTLVIRGYLIEKDNQYRLSTKLLGIGYNVVNETKLLQVAIEPMRETSLLLHETVIIGKIMDSHGIVLESIPSDYPIKYTIDAGHKFELHTSAPGKAMLAYMLKNEAKQIIDNMIFTRYNENTITSKTQMYKALSQVKMLGYAVDAGEKMKNLHCIAAPIFNYQNRVVAAIWITGPADRLPLENLDYLGKQLIQQANKISFALGYTP